MTKIQPKVFRISKTFSVLFLYYQISTQFFVYLHSERSLLDFLDAFLDDEWYSFRVALQHLGEISAEQLEPSLQLFVATLDSQGLQTLLMAGQEALQHTNKDLSIEFFSCMPYVTR